MAPFSDAPRLLTPGALDRRTLVKGVSLRAGAVVLQPFLDSLAADAEGSPVNGTSATMSTGISEPMSGR